MARAVEASGRVLPEPTDDERQALLALLRAELAEAAAPKTGFGAWAAAGVREATGQESED
jgi:hypothetical protein